MMAVLLLRSVSASRPAPITDSRMALPKRSKKWVSVSPSSPPRPSWSVAGEPMSIETPSGVMMRDHTDEGAGLAQGHAAAILADQLGAARDQYGRAVEAPHVAAYHGAHKTGQVGIDRGLEHGGNHRPLRRRMGEIVDPRGMGHVHVGVRNARGKALIRRQFIFIGRVRARALPPPAPSRRRGHGAAPAAPGDWLKSTTMAGAWGSEVT